MTTEPTASAERTALHRRPRVDWMNDMPPNLYPRYIPAHRYLGTGGGCTGPGPRFYYEPDECDRSRLVLVECLAYWRADPISPEPSGPPVRTALYRLLDADQRLLYVGISANPTRRWTEHAAQKDWWPQVAHISIQWHASQPAASASEKQAIKEERPVHNISHAVAPPCD